MTDTHVCPHCGQRMLMRHGVRLPPKCADIFDMIERAGDRGVAPEVLQWIFFANRPRKAAYAGLRAHIWQINELLASTDLHIGMREYRRGLYRVEQRRPWHDRRHALRAPASRKRTYYDVAVGNPGAVSMHDRLDRRAS